MSEYDYAAVYNALENAIKALKPDCGGSYRDVGLIVARNLPTIQHALQMAEKGDKAGVVDVEALIKSIRNAKIWTLKDEYVESYVVALVKSWAETTHADTIEKAEG